MTVFGVADPKIGQSSNIIDLAINAREAMPKGGTLVLRTAPTNLDGKASGLVGLEAGRYCELMVQDTGVGMSEDELENVFEPFFTTKDRRQGTGLGLSTVYGIIKQSGGGIRVTSSPGSGTTFRIYLPFTEEEKSQTVTPDPGEMPELEARKTVLLVEDEEAVRHLAEEVLRTEGHRVLVAVDGKDALAKIEQVWDDVDLLITDVVMPIMSGPKLAELIAERRSDLPVLFISGYSEDGMLALEESLSSGKAYLSKPFTPTVLKKKVRQLLSLERARAGT
jgi:CheY-like chemotaxis protein